MIKIELVSKEHSQDYLGLGAVTHLFKCAMTGGIIAIVGTQDNKPVIYVKKILDIDMIQELAKASRYIV